ncbi:YopX family protein [Listeria newyorkensis]|uniref:YopX protein domain-containing protein n=1 Tax=Listeria newyorkensis TaxID=1497681 RepID=A0A841YZK1_9LIST|nr:YopX family protein [Listeria newyorkensis]MBC1459361.1 hypothetical protein [Listeria newyorkensis]
MRPIEFRAWDNVEGKMYDNRITDLHIDTKGVISSATVYDDNFKPHRKSVGVDIELMQYTGLPDKNKQKYCQDDIVRYKGKNYRLIKGTYKFELLGFKESLQDDPYDFFSEGAYLQGEIVGNIHENPELLKEGAE